MNRLFGYILGAVAFSLLGGSASAQQMMRVKGMESPPPKEEAAAPIYNDACGDNGCDNGHWWFDVEFTFLRLHRSDDFDDANEEDLFGFEASPRLTVAYVGADGLGARLRWWQYDHSERAGEDLFAIDTYNLDLELFQEYKVGACTRVEVSGGVRFNSTDFLDEDDELNTQFDGVGIVIGARVTRQVSCHGALYAGIRHAWLMGDNVEDGSDDSFNSTRTQFEGALGYEYTRCLSNDSILTLRAGVEMQHWAGFDDEDEEEALGFGGFVLGAGLKY